MRKRLSLLLFLIFLFSLFSCGQEKVVKKYYLLDYSAKETAADSSAQKTLPYSVRIDPFLTAGTINSNRIALRNNSNEIQYYYYHFWAENPAATVRYFLLKAFKKSSLFEHCSLHSGTRTADFLVSGRLDYLERLRTDDKYYAHLAMSLELHEFRSGKIVVQHSFDRLTPIEEDSPMNVFAKEVSAVLYEETQKFIEQIRENIKSFSVETK